MERKSATITMPSVAEGRLRRTKAGQAAEVIKQRIKRGIYMPGQQLPSIRALSSDLNMTAPAIQRAVRQLEAEGLLESRHGVGIRILTSADCRTTPLVFGFVQPYFSYFSLALQHFLEDALDSRSNLCVIKSTHNNPEREREQIDKLINSGINGLLIWPVDGDPNAQFLQETARRLPVVFVDRTVDGARAPSVILGYKQAGEQIVRSLSKSGRGRILTVCDPADISSFNQLKAGMRDEVLNAKGSVELTVVDQPIIELIESSYRGDYDPADLCYKALAPLLTSGRHDAIFSPQCEFFDSVFAHGNRADILGSLARVSVRTLDGPPLSRGYYELGVEEWIADTAKMLVVAMDLLQDMTLRRNNPSRTVRVPIKRAK
jgi:DNA-binding LacI/PurR family transcriptional regulator